MGSPAAFSDLFWRVWGWAAPVGSPAAFADASALVRACSQSLKAQLLDHKSFTTERIASLLEDRRLREVDVKRQLAVLDQQAIDAEGRYGRLQKALEDATRQMIQVMLMFTKRRGGRGGRGGGCENGADMLWMRNMDHAGWR